MSKNLWDVPNVLMQKFPAEEFTATAKLEFTPNAKLKNEKAGLVVMGLSDAGVFLKSKKERLDLIFVNCMKAFRIKP